MSERTSVSSNEGPELTPRMAVHLARQARDEEHARGVYSRAAGGTPSATQRALRQAVTRSAGGPALAAALCLLLVRARTATERLDAFAVLDYLVVRSSTARAAVLARLRDVVLPLCCESDAARQPLPPPRRDAVRLQHRACAALQVWARRFGAETPLLADAARAAHRLRTGEAASAVHAAHVRAQAVQFAALARIVRALDADFEPVRRTLDGAVALLEECFAIVVPRFGSGDNSIGDGDGSTVISESSREAARDAVVFAPKVHREGDPVPPPSPSMPQQQQLEIFGDASGDAMHTEAATTASTTTAADAETNEEDKPLTLELFGLLMKAMSADETQDAGDFEQQLASFVGSDDTAGTAGTTAEGAAPEQEEEEEEEEEGAQRVSGVVSDDYRLTLEIDVDTAFREIGREADASVRDVMDTLRDYARLLSTRPEMAQKGAGVPAVRLHAWAVQLTSLRDYTPETASERELWARAMKYFDAIAALTDRITRCKAQLRTLGIDPDAPPAPV